MLLGMVCIMSCNFFFIFPFFIFFKKEKNNLQLENGQVLQFETDRMFIKTLCEMHTMRPQMHDVADGAIATNTLIWKWGKVGGNKINAQAVRHRRSVEMCLQRYKMKETLRLLACEHVNGAYEERGLKERDERDNFIFKWRKRGRVNRPCEGGWIDS